MKNTRFAVGISLRENLLKIIMNIFGAFPGCFKEIIHKISGNYWLYGKIGIISTCVFLPTGEHQKKRVFVFFSTEVGEEKCNM